jgi:DNA polymerase III subunit epsilon
MYIFYDTETTGTHAQARMTQLAFALYDEQGNKLEEYQAFIKPDGWVIPREKFFLDNGMTTERNQELGIPLYEALRRFQDALKLANYKVAHNHSFDNRIVSGEIARTSITPELFKYKKSFCTMLSTVEWVKAPNKNRAGYKWPNMQELYKACFGKNFENDHDALGDITALAECFFYLKQNGIIKI